MSFSRNLTSKQIVTLFVISNVLFLGLASSRGQFVKAERAVAAAEAMGFAKAKITEEHRWFPIFTGCSASDAAGFEMKVEHSDGKKTDITFCCGWLKKCTPRW